MNLRRFREREGAMEEETMAAAANYYSKDFEWDELRQEIENNPSFAHHLLPFPDSITQNQHTLLSQEDSEAWNKFHTRHSTGKFFKVSNNDLVLFSLHLYTILPRFNLFV